VFKVTPANIRHHLSILTEQGSVSIIGQKAGVERGRPSQIYSCTQQRQQNNLDQLADVLLNAYLSDARQGEREPLLKNIAERLVRQYPINTENPTRRLYSSIRALNHMNYQAHWEAHVENPRIMLGHCPYFGIQGEHPEVCLMDAFVLEKLIGKPVKQAERLVLNSKGLPQCVFLVE
jgi:predicted ArsR family transcriptional regulator